MMIDEITNQLVEYLIPYINQLKLYLSKKNNNNNNSQFHYRDLCHLFIEMKYFGSNIF